MRLQTTSVPLAGRAGVRDAVAVFSEDARYVAPDPLPAWLASEGWDERRLRARARTVPPRMPTPSGRPWRTCSQTALYITRRRARNDSTATNDTADSTPNTLRNDPIESTENAEPIEPMEANDPTLPTESTEPVLPIDRNELRERMLKGLETVRGVMNATVTKHVRLISDYQSGRPTDSARSDT